MTVAVLDQAAALLESCALCDACLGRQFAALGHGLSVEERGHALRVTLCLERDRPLEVPDLCELCLGHFGRVERWAETACERVCELELEFSTYLVGTRVPGFLEEAEERLRRRHGITTGEPFKQSYNRAVGKRFGQLLLERQGRRVEVDFREPEVLIRVDLLWERLDLQIHPLYLYGRYRKLARGLPQTHWPCRACRGRGCDRCGGTGKQYPESVEELISAPVLARTRGSGAAFHGAGREDIDARMLGSGRPFVLEVKEPRRRALDWAALACRINAQAAGKVEVQDLRPVKRKAVERLKQVPARKRYRMEVRFDRPVSAQALEEALARLVGEVRQRTPQRVAHRRADLVRRRRVYRICGELIEPDRARIELECDGGLYVKELISGDDGRTRPSLAERLQVPVHVRELDVLEVLGPFTPESKPDSDQARP